MYDKFTCTSVHGHTTCDVHVLSLHSVGLYLGFTVTLLGTYTYCPCIHLGFGAWTDSKFSSLMIGTKLIRESDFKKIMKL